MSSVEEYNIDELFKTLLHPKVIEWDFLITRLKKSAPVPDVKLKEMWSRHRELDEEIHSIYDRTRTPNMAHNFSQWRPLKSLSRKLMKDIDDIYENFTEADPDESHSPSLNPVAATSPEEQSLSQAIAIADTEATNVKHHEEDKNEEEFLNADVQAKRPRRKRKKKHQGMCSLKPTPRPAKLNKSLMMKLLLRRKMILIPNRVRNLLDPAPRPQCHHFPARKLVKPTIQPAVYSSKPVPGGASSLLQVRIRSSGGSIPQSRVRQANVNSRSSNRTDEAVSVPNVLYAKYHDSFPAETDFYSAQDNAVRFWHSPIT